MAHFALLRSTSPLYSPCVLGCTLRLEEIEQQNAVRKSLGNPMRGHGIVEFLSPKGSWQALEKPERLIRGS